MDGFWKTLGLGALLSPVLYALYLASLIVIPYLKSLPLRRKLRHLPGPPVTGFFLLGNVPDLVRTPVHQCMARWAEQYGKIFKLELPTMTAVVLTDPEAVSQVLKVDRFEKLTTSYQNMEKLTAEQQPNILTEPLSAYYKAVRRAVTPAFSTANLRRFFPLLLDITQQVMTGLAAAGPSAALDLDRVAQRLTIDVIGRFAFDRDFGATADIAKTNEALQVVGELMTALQRMLNPLNRWFWWRKEARGLWASRRRYDALVRRALEDLRSSPPAQHTLLHHLMSLTDPDTGKPLSARRLRSETALFWIAGFETTAHAIGWTLMFIAGSPEVESRVAAELEGAGLLAVPGRPEPRQLAWGDLGGLKYLNAVIHESMRLMPPTSGGTVRVVPRDTQLAGHVLPKGTMLWIPFYAMQRSERVWGPDAAQFRPERWLAAAAGAGGPGVAAEEDDIVRAADTQSARGFLPFSEGPRNCVGQSLALLELRTALALLCGSFRFRLADDMGGVEGAVSEARQHITLKPGDRGLLMHAIPRVPA
ncbi:hypothetical protein CHLRE_07g356250v5 [Chlamydomonas reinhardtii]|uniref:Cytochrome P450 n=1 Tax=Chlamydomonas reinhardtii TaxID=3055 RepID=A0A2K3DLQ0_CHLRE|nr:uncharacterized protein CHLRE_07g356250v5 [Chlamydomonas reinhardtii]PNW81441.1 hypothetical protein CHLRE_07g356250v5 [Chlamydomonas reinhardtii]